MQLNEGHIFNCHIDAVVGLKAFELPLNICFPFASARRQDDALSRQTIYLAWNERFEETWMTF
jgi:hypothetical protein